MSNPPIPKDLPAALARVPRRAALSSCFVRRPRRGRLVATSAVGISGRDGRAVGHAGAALPPATVIEGNYQGNPEERQRLRALR